MAEETGEAAAGKKKGKGGLLIGLALFLAVGGAAVMVGFVGFPGKATHAAGHAEAAPEHDEKPMTTVMLPVPQLLVNLSDSAGNRLLQSTWTVQIGTRDAAAMASLGPELLPRIQDQMIKVLSSLRSDEIAGGANKEFVQTRLKDALNGSVFKDRDEKVEALFFTEFVVQ